MNRVPIVVTFCLTVAAITATVPHATAYSADPKTAECLSASNAALALREQHKLRAGRAQLLICAEASCPMDVRNECVRLVDQVNASIPTIIFEAKSSAGDLSAVRVTMDGELLTERLDGTALAIDPGERLFGFETAGQKPVVKRMIIAEAQKNRREWIVFGSTAAQASGPDSPGAADDSAWAKTFDRARQDEGRVTDTERQQIQTTREKQNWYLQLSGVVPLAILATSTSVTEGGYLLTFGAGAILPLGLNWQLYLGGNGIIGSLRDSSESGMDVSIQMTVPSDAIGLYASAVARARPLGPLSRWFLEAGLEAGAVHVAATSYDEAETLPWIQAVAGTGVTLGRAERFGISAQIIAGLPLLAGVATVQFVPSF